MFYINWFAGIQDAGRSSTYAAVVITDNATAVHSAAFWRAAVN
jgi:hypothetical protein